MTAREILRKQFEKCEKMLRGISEEELSDHDSTRRSVSPQGIKFYNNIARRFNSLFIDTNIELFSEDTTASSVLHLKTQEIQAQVEIALDFLRGENVGRRMEVEPFFTARNFDTSENICFVLMAFREELRPIYDDHIKKIASKFNIISKRADDIFNNTAIMEDIWKSICSARIIIADLTNKNPNVFYEVGIAHTVGKDVILISQSMDDVPFDLRHLRLIKYTYTPRGMQLFEQQLENTIGAMLGVPR